MTQDFVCINNVPIEIAKVSILIIIETFQIVLGDADDAEYADARRLFIFFKTIYYLRLSALVCVISVP